MTKLPTMRYLSLGSKVLGVCAQFFILEKQHASTTCSDGFVSIKANSTHLSECTGMATFIKTADTFGCVFNQFDMPLTADIRQFIYFYGMAESVHGNTSFYTTTGTLVIANSFFQFSIPLQPCLDSSGRKSHRFFVHINKNRICSDISDSIASSDEGQSLGEHLIIAFYTH